MSWKTHPVKVIDYYAASPFTGGIASGHGACNGELSEADCSSCMLVAHDQISFACDRRVGGQVQLKDCRLRFEIIYPFIE